jgi:AraC-like DNA-binding protein
MPERSLQRNFQREVGMSIGQWRQQSRILIGLEKLTEGLSVTDTCFAVGYNNVSAFIKTFKRTVGMPPLEYIKKQRNSLQMKGPLLTESHPANSALSRKSGTLSKSWKDGVALKVNGSSFAGP